MKKFAIVGMAIGLALASVSVQAESLRDEFANQKLCKVQVCNKIERFSLDIWSHVKDSMGEVCFTTVMPESEVELGKVISSESRWYQGSSINPTKESVTRIKQILQCEA